MQMRLAKELPIGYMDDLPIRVYLQFARRWEKTFARVMVLMGLGIVFLVFNIIFKPFKRET